MRLQDVALFRGVDARLVMPVRWKLATGIRRCRPAPRQRTGSSDVRPSRSSASACTEAGRSVGPAKAARAGLPEAERLSPPRCAGGSPPRQGQSQARQAAGDKVGPAQRLGQRLPARRRRRASRATPGQEDLSPTATRETCLTRGEKQIGPTCNILAWEMSMSAQDMFFYLISYFFLSLCCFLVPFPLPTQISQ